jgi:hypothetical protein
MSYIIYEKINKITNSKFLPIKNKSGMIIKFKNKRIANFERIYLQPDYDNQLVVKKGE